MYARRLHPSVLALSISLYRHPSIYTLFNSRFISYNKLMSTHPPLPKPHDPSSHMYVDEFETKPPVYLSSVYEVCRSISFNFSSLITPTPTYMYSLYHSFYLSFIIKPTSMSTVVILMYHLYHIVSYIRVVSTHPPLPSPLDMTFPHST